MKHFVGIKLYLLRQKSNVVLFEAPMRAKSSLDRIKYCREDIEKICSMALTELDNDDSRRQNVFPSPVCILVFTCPRVTSIFQKTFTYFMCMYLCPSE